MYIRKAKTDQNCTFQTTEFCPLDSEREGKCSIAESVQQNIRRVINKDLKKKHRTKLSFAERKVLLEMEHGKNISIYPFNIGTEFETIKDKGDIHKIEEQI